MSNYIVYGLYDPNSAEPFYIGYSKNKNRPKEHILEAKRKNNKKKSSRKINYIRKLFQKGKIPIIKILFETSVKQQAIFKEIELIKKYGRLDLDTGILTNHTDGGDGFAEPSKERRKQISLQTSGTNNPMYGKTHSAEVCKAAGIRGSKLWSGTGNFWYGKDRSGNKNPMFGKISTMRNKTLEEIHGRERAANIKKAISSKNKGKIVSSETRKKQSISRLKWVDNSEYTWIHKIYGEECCTRYELQIKYPALDIDIGELGQTIKGKYSHRGWKIKAN